jgi:hypothetical protein
MLICPDCGAENAVGRVFCDACGIKLDLTNMAAETVAEMTKVSWVRRYWPWGVVVIVAIILLNVFLLYWPRAEVIGQAGTLVGAARVEAAFGELQQVTSGDKRSAEIEFTEKDINGFFRYGMAEELGMLAVTVEVYDGYLKVRAIRRMWEWKLIGFVWQPMMTYDLICVPYGGQIVVKKVSVGHLRVRGPFRTRVIRKFYSGLAAQDDWKAFGALSSITAASGKVTVTAGK